MEENRREEHNQEEIEQQEIRQEEAKPEFEERDATLDDDPIPTLSADEVQDSILEDSGMNAFQKFCARMDEKRWSLAQRITGALLGVAAGVALFWESLTGVEGSQQQGFFSMPLIIAVVIALLIPNVVEKQSQRSVAKLRIALVISLALIIVIYFVYITARGGFHLTN